MLANKKERTSKPCDENVENNCFQNKTGLLYTLLENIGHIWYLGFDRD
jgi:hypothetical protein